MYESYDAYTGQSLLTLSLCSFCKLIAVIGHAEEGLARFIAYLCNVLGNEARSDFEAIMANVSAAQIGGESGDETAYVALLQRLFGVVANIFQRYEKFIVGSFGGPVAVLQLAQSMQTETESHATKIVIHFMKTRKVAQLVNKIDLEVNLILYYSNLQPHSQTVGTGEAGKVSSA